MLFFASNLLLLEFPFRLIRSLAGALYTKRRNSRVVEGLPSYIFGWLGTYILILRKYLLLKFSGYLSGYGLWVFPCSGSLELRCLA